MSWRSAPDLGRHRPRLSRLMWRSRLHRPAASGADASADDKRQERDDDASRQSRAESRLKERGRGSGKGEEAERRLREAWRRRHNNLRGWRSTAAEGGGRPLTPGRS